MRVNPAAAYPEDTHRHDAYRPECLPHSSTIDRGIAAGIGGAVTAIAVAAGPRATPPPLPPPPLPLLAVGLGGAVADMVGVLYCFPPTKG